jgi:hypothetical protein
MMTTAPGWYPDHDNDHITRYWDGARWTDEKTWNGEMWVDHVRVAAPPPVQAPVPARTIPVAMAVDPSLGTPTSAGIAPVIEQLRTALQLGDKKVPQGITFWAFAAGVFGIAISAFVPWVQVSGFGYTGSTSAPTGAGPLLLLGLAAGIAGFGYSSFQARLTVIRRIGVSVVAALASGLLLLGMAHVVDLNDSYQGVLNVSPGAGMYANALGILSVWVGLACSLLPSRSADVTS